MATDRVVIDTNVFISALIGQRSYPYQIFDELIVNGRVCMCLSPALIGEYRAVSQREKFQKYPSFQHLATRILSIIENIAEMTDPAIHLEVLGDDPDNRLLELAVAVNARVIVTGNVRDFKFTEFQGVLIQSPKDFYESYF